MHRNNVDTLVKKGSSTNFVVANSVIRNTYILLSMTLLFSALTAFISSVTNAPYVGLGLGLLINFGLIYLVNSLRNSAWGILAVFIFTGFFGYTLGPILNSVLTVYVNGAQLITTSLGLTGAVFFTLSGYAMVSRKNFNYLAGFLMAGVIVGFATCIIAYFIPMPLLYLATSAVFVLLSSAAILFHTSQIINGGETNYIIATINLYVQIYNLFVSFLQILTMFSGRRN